MALLLVSLMATGSLSEAEEATRIFAHLKSKDGKLCPVTGKKTFVEALAQILSSEELSERVLDVEVWQATMKARISLRAKEQPWIRKVVISDFGRPREARNPG